MNSNDNSLLIKEDRLYAALRPMRTDHAAFKASVQQRVEDLKVLRAADRQEQPGTASGWRQIAAAVMPPVLVGNSAGSMATVAKISLGKKLIGFAALPAIALFLMIGGTVLGFARIRQAKVGEQTGNVDFEELYTAQKQWWKKFGGLITAVFFISLLSPFTGVSVVFPVLLLSGVVAVSLVRSLSRDGVVNRRAIAGGLGMGLGQLASITHIGMFMRSGVYLLDQALIPAVLSFGSFLLITMSIWGRRIDSPKYRFSSRRLLIPIVILFAISVMLHGVNLLLAGFAIASAITLVVMVFRSKKIGLADVCIGLLFGTFGIAFSGWFAQSLWAPITESTLREYVESFDEARFSSASWRQWAVPAAWLIDSGIDVDMQKPHRLLDSESSGARNPFILKSAYRAGLMTVEDAAQHAVSQAQKNRLIYEGDPESKFNQGRRAAGSLGQPIGSISQSDGVVRSLLLSGNFSDAERDLLEVRLVATFRKIPESLIDEIEGALTVTRLLQAIERPESLGEFRPLVHDLLLEMQCPGGRIFQSRGGFSQSRRHRSCSDLATAYAVELMQHYGVPEGIDVPALRSYLRPSMQDRGLRGKSRMRAPINAAVLMRLESLPDVPPPTVWDYVWYEMNLWMAVLLVLLCVYATASAPQRDFEGAVPNWIFSYADDDK